MSKTAKGLIDYAKAQLGLPYWYGTFGVIATAELYKAKQKQYPKYYASWNDFPSQYGKRVHDCVGLIKGYLWSDTVTSVPRYNGSQDVSANGMRGLCKDGGSIGTMPDTPGILVFMDGHVGVYIGGGEVVEARGHEYGVVKTRLANRPWKWWGKCPWIDYNDTTNPTQTVVSSSITTKKVRLKAGTWNVRKLPDLESSSLTVVSGGKEIEIVDGWEYVPSIGGFISKKAIE